jgi:hypothetical protein
MIRSDLFFEPTNSVKKNYKWRILVYPNITQSADLEKDSFIVVIKNIIKYFNECRDGEVYWVVLSPRDTISLQLPNVEVRHIDLPTYPNSMRTHFNWFELMKAIRPDEEDYDFVYSHLPEHTAQLKNLFANGSNNAPVFIGYNHWVEVPENTSYPENLFHLNLQGMLAMEECGVNSEWLKRLIVRHSKELLSSDLVRKLEQVIQPHYLGSVPMEVQLAKARVPKTVIFNHRFNEYTGWDWFSKAMDTLWEKRQDFTVYTTVEDPDKPWCKREKLPSRKDYMRFLSSVSFGVGCFRNYSAWSISVTDGFSVGTPYLLPNDFCYPEMMDGFDYPDEMFYRTEKGFLTNFEHHLDNPPDSQTNEMCLAISKNLTWQRTIPRWFNDWKFLDEDEMYVLKNSESIEEIKALIQKFGFMTKNDIINNLGWGRGIKWNPYRNMLRLDKRIELTHDGYSWKS